MRTLETVEMNEVSGGCFGLLGGLFSCFNLSSLFCMPQQSYCSPQPTYTPAPTSCAPQPTTCAPKQTSSCAPKQTKSCYGW